ncbi:MAG TPA: HAD family hydrolase [Comamonas sp.]
MSSVPQTQRSRLALFDLDHTLIPMDSDHGWGEFAIAIGWCDREEFGRRNDEFFAHYQAGTLNVHDYVRFATEAVVQRGQVQAQAAHERFMEAVIRPAMKPQAIELVQSHLRAGDTVVITSATNEFVTRPIAAAFGVKELIATELERDSSGWFTGAVKGLPNMREGKVARMDAWLAARGLSWDAVESTFYSDSMNDVPLLERVNHPVATNPEPRLRALAQERGWRVLDLFTENP